MQQCLRLTRRSIPRASIASRRWFRVTPRLHQDATANRRTSVATLRKAAMEQTKDRAYWASTADDDFVEVTVDGNTVQVPSGVTVLQACEAAGVTIPRFCFHDRLSIAGNCRMCLVEVEKAKKPVASCAMPIMPGMKIMTDTRGVQTARDNVLEMILANHPIDCPICDQGGECDLQDIYYYFGKSAGKYDQNAYGGRVVEDKDLGPFIVTHMTRCIHCTRCVRFADEVAGNEMLGTSGRGNATEIGTYVEAFFDSEVSGNVIDLCPVGALNNRPSAYRSRPWELSITETIDTSDAVGTNIALETRGQEIIKTKPRLNEDVNEEWVADRARFHIDGLNRQRLDTPLVLDRTTGEYHPVTWPDALIAAKQAIVSRTTDANRSSTFAAVAGNQADLESMLVLKEFTNKLGSNNTICAVDNVIFDPDVRSNYLNNASIRGIEAADVILMVGCNPRMEAPLVNTRIRKAYLDGADIYYIGNKFEWNYELTHLGDNPSLFVEIARQEHNTFVQDVLSKAESPVVMIGMSALSSGSDADIQAIESAVKLLASNGNSNLIQPDWNGICYLHTSASRVGALDIGFVPGPDVADGKDKYKDLKVAYLMHVDDEFEDMSAIFENDDCFVIYQGSHGDVGASNADIILPGAAYSEKSGTFVNMDGRVQRTLAAVGPPGHGRVDWQVVRALSEVCGIPIQYTHISQVRDRLEEIAPYLTMINTDIEYPVFDALSLNVQDEAEMSKMTSDALVTCNVPLKIESFKRYYESHFLTSPIHRASLVMNRAAKVLPKSNNSWA